MRLEALRFWTNKVILIDASKLGEEYKDGNNQKRRLRNFEVDKKQLNSLKFNE